MAQKDSSSAKPAKAVGHARTKPPQRPKAKGHGGTVESRIAHIEGLMRSLSYRTGKTAKQLAAQWGLALATVEKDTAEASRRVRASVMGDREHIGASVGAALETALQNAVKAKEWRVVAQLADTWAKIAGVVAPTRSEHSGPGGASILFDLTGITNEQLKACLAEDDAGDPGGAPAADAGGAGAPRTGDGKPA